MCYSALVKADIKTLEREYGARSVAHLWTLVYETRKMDPARVKIPDADQRIFPGYVAPIIYRLGEARVIEPMRYSAFAPAYVSKPSILSTFNARRDNLQSLFWAEAFRIHHGFIAIDAFFEWVDVKDLIAGKIFSLDAIVEEFARLSHKRKIQVEEQGKTWRPTPTERKEAIDRKIVIAFTPRNGTRILAPVIFSESSKTTDVPAKGFAILTDEPFSQIRQAGHDRMPIALKREAVEEWLDPSQKSTEDLNRLLDEQVENLFTIGFPEAVA